MSVDLFGEICQNFCSSMTQPLYCQSTRCPADLEKIALWFANLLKTLGDLLYTVKRDVAPTKSTIRPQEETLNFSIFDSALDTLVKVISLKEDTIAELKECVHRSVCMFGKPACAVAMSQACGKEQKKSHCG